MSIIELNIDTIRELCRKYSVAEMYSFGSVNDDRFNDASDVNLVVDFSTNDPIDYTDNYFALKLELENLLKRPIDLLKKRGI